MDIGDFARAVTGLRPDLAPLTKGVMSSDQALCGFKAAMDAALGRGSQAPTYGLRTSSELASFSYFPRQPEDDVAVALAGAAAT